MTIGSLFSGVGGLELGLCWAGLGPVVFQVESDPFCRGVLAMHWPNADRKVTDVREAGRANLAPVDLICGGFPCQDIAVCGPRTGIEGERSGLWREFARIVEELSPRFVVVENVPRLVTEGLDTVARDLDRCGYRSFARLIRASDVGAPQKRERLFIVADDHSRALRDEEQRQPARHAHRVRDEGIAESRNNGDQSGGLPQSGMGRDADGLPSRLERWPAGRGEPQSLWEPPRVIGAHAPTWGDRLHALGNAVVPQCAYEVGLFVRELLEREAA